MSGHKILNHPQLGSLELGFEVLTMPDDSGHRILTYTAEQGSEAAAALAWLQGPPLTVVTVVADDANVGQAV